MDVLDRKILNIVQKNSRITVKQIAEECFISSPSVSVRLQNLEGMGYIRTYQAILDHQKLGFLIKAYVNCAVNAKDKQDFYRYIEEIPNVVECDCITGDYSMLLKVFFSNTIELDEFITDLTRFGDTKTHIVFSTNVGPRGLQIQINESAKTPRVISRRFCLFFCVRRNRCTSGERPAGRRTIPNINIHLR